MLRLSSGLPRQAGSANRLSPLAGATSELPSAIDNNSRPSVAARDATAPGLRARFNANLLHDVFGIIRSAIPRAELVNSRSSGAANSSAPSKLVATTLFCLLECRWAKSRGGTNRHVGGVADPSMVPIVAAGVVVVQNKVCARVVYERTRP